MTKFVAWFKGQRLRSNTNDTGLLIRNVCPGNETSAVSRKAHLKGTCRPFSAFWRPENTTYAESWTPLFKGSFELIVIFGTLKIRLLPSLVPHGSRVRIFVRTHFLHFGGLKMQFLPSRKTHGSRVRSFMRTFSPFWRPENVIFADRWDPRFKDFLLHVTSFSVFWRFKNRYVPGHETYRSEGRTFI